jgi:hypothetical protein
LDRRDRKSLRKALEENSTRLKTAAKIIAEEIQGRNARMQTLYAQFHGLILAHPEWVRSKKDLDALIASENFWPRLGIAFFYSSELKKLAAKAIENLSYRFPQVWQYEPGAAEQLHNYYRKALLRLGRYPASLQKQSAFWKTLTRRGVSSLSDGLFQEIYGQADKDLKVPLEKAARAGRIWDQQLKAAIVESNLQQSPAYRELVASSPVASGVSHFRREFLLQSLLTQLAQDMPEKGPYYLDILERLSTGILSSKHESALIHGAKSLDSGARSEDLGLRLLSALSNEALAWPLAQQWELVLFLRGDAPPSKRLQEDFKLIGTERVKRFYDLLPVPARALFLSAFFDSPRGLFPAVSPPRGWGKTMLAHVLPKNNPEAHAVARDMLEAFLYSLEKTGQPAVRSYVMAYLLALPPQGDGGVGQTLKDVLELFGPTGVKIGQFLVASRILPERETEILVDLQEKANPPLRQAIYEDSESILAPSGVPFATLDLKGAASIKYAFLARERTSSRDLVMKVFRQEGIAHTPLEFLQLSHMADYLSRRHGPKYGIFRAIVKASRKAVERELISKDEVEKSARAAREIYAGAGTAEVSFEVPRERLMHERLIASEFAPGSSVRELPGELKALAATEILRAETANLFRDAQSLSFDPDRHPGNYRVESVSGAEGRRLKVHPIDFGQLSTISRAQREQFFELFALSQILARTGRTGWALAELGRIMGVPQQRRAALGRALARYFPAAEAKPLAAYFGLLTACDEAGLEPDIVFFDFARAVVQLGPYEAWAGRLDFEPASVRLEKELLPRVERMRAALALTPLEKLRIVLGR